jgi:hypothetical protein
LTFQENERKSPTFECYNAEATGFRAMASQA